MCLPACSLADPQTGPPIGVLLTGGRFREDWCLDAAEAIERLNAAKTLIDDGTAARPTRETLRRPA
jgi:amidase